MHGAGLGGRAPASGCGRVVIAGWRQEISFSILERLIDFVGPRTYGVSKRLHSLHDAKIFYDRGGLGRGGGV